MHVEFLNHYSGNLNQEMYLNRYGHSGMPIVVFPSSGGSKDEFADFGMIAAANQFIENGTVQFFTLSTHDNESWLRQGKSQHDRAEAHNAYDRYVIEEAIPFIKHHTGWFDPMMVTGCSMGAYHALNFQLKHPDVFSKCLALSGIYDVRFFGGEFGDDQAVYFNSPVDYIWTLDDPWFIDHLRRADIVVCTGLGDWEQDGLPGFYKMREAFESKNIPAWFAEWGYDVSHDWIWWRQQLPYFLGHMF